MCTKEDLIEYLEDLPTGTEVDLLAQDTSGYNAYSEWEPLSLGVDTEDDGSIITASNLLMDG